MFVLFSFIHEEKERQITRTTPHSSVISVSNSSDLQGITGLTISTPRIVSYRTDNLHVKFSFPGCTSGREFIFNNVVSSLYSSCQFHFTEPVIPLMFLRKVPEQGQRDDIPLVS
jgi:hypothetical protein